MRDLLAAPGSFRSDAHPGSLRPTIYPSCPVPPRPANPMPKTSPQRLSSSLLVLTIALLSPFALPAQVALAPATAAKPAPKEEAITLNTFQVSADANDTYDATNTNSVTGTNTPLSKTPLDAKVFNRQLMDELGIVDATEMLAKFGGLGPAVIGSGNEDVRGNLEGDRQDPKSMTMRGLQINNPRRDGFLRSDTTLLDSFDIERVEAIGGSNSLLFGSGDAGGVVTSNSKRAYLNRRSLALTGTADSEGSYRTTLDANAGNKFFAVRVNAVKANTKYFRPNLSQATEGIHVTTTVRPLKWLEFRGEYRDYSRDAIIAQAVIVRAPLTLLLPNGARVDNQNSRYLAAFPESRNLTDGKFDLTTVDSAIGPYRRDAYFNQLKSVVAEATLAEGLAVQLRYGHDARVNQSLNPSSTSVYAPGATGNFYVDPTTGAIGNKWAMNQTLNDAPFWTGARGYRASVAYQKNLGRWGSHQLSAFHQDMDSWVNSESWRFYETDASGNIIQDLARLNNTESGRNAMPAVWLEAFPKNLFGNAKWFTRTISHPNGKTYKLSPQIYPYAVPATAGNPLGLSGPVNATTGQTSVSTGVYGHDDTRETSYGFSTFSSWWRDRIDTMVGYRTEEASAYRVQTDLRRGPITYNSITTGAVFDTGIKGLRGSFNYSTNGKINFDTTRDVYNQPLPVGKGTSKDIGLKFGLWENRVSGNFNYYVSEAENFTATLPSRDDVDPNGINGRFAGNAYVYSKTSDGYNLTLSTRPLSGWEVRINFATANGSERSNVTVPQYYNDQFNTTTVGGQSVVAVKTGGTLAPFLVPSNPLDPTSAQVPLSLAMLKDQTSPYFAQLDIKSGQILNAQTLGLLTPGIGTGVNGLSLTNHQLGFISPSGGTLIVRRAGEATVGYAERAYSVINRYQFDRGVLKGVVVGLSTSYQQNYRAYMYNDAAAANQRKMFYFPDRTLHDVFAIYRFRPTKWVTASVQLNIANVLDTNRTLYLLSSTNGTLRYAQWFNAPRKYSLTTSLRF
jgi:outer membrane receptor protein involved in Fe transport